MSIFMLNLVIHKNYWIQVNKIFILHIVFYWVRFFEYIALSQKIIEWFFDLATNNIFFWFICDYEYQGQIFILGFKKKLLLWT